MVCIHKCGARGGHWPKRNHCIRDQASPALETSRVGHSLTPLVARIASPLRLGSPNVHALVLYQDYTAATQWFGRVTFKPARALRTRIRAHQLHFLVPR
jgi:hypothetical protein